jgi:SAM-dependent methyltransferase
MLTKISLQPMKSLISLALRYIPRKYLQLFSHWIARFLSIFYLGNRVSCNVCGHHYRKFLPYGRQARTNALCPHCLSLERHRMMWLFLKERTNFFEAKLKVLHIAPELCFIKRFESLHGDNYITADIESPLAKVKLDVLQMPFTEGEFEVVFCNHVMEHVSDDLHAMREIYRVLAPGGWGIIQVPLFYPLPEVTYEDNSIVTPAEREKAFGQDDHVRLYGKDYINRLQSAGFKAEEIWLNKELPEAEVKRLVLPLDEPVFYVRKSSQSADAAVIS